MFNRLSGQLSDQRVTLYDTTLRDGSQGEDVLFSLEDKLRITERLDALGVDYIEGGWPGANPKDEAFFRAAKKLSLTQSRLTAFGSTRRTGFSVEQDPTIQGLLRAETGVITLFGKSWDLHVTQALGISLEENLQIIFDSIHYLKQQVDEVFYDAEHFFDGYHLHADYAIQTLEAAQEAGADCLVLCDTNGGMLPEFITSTIHEIQKRVTTPLGIHCHNDSDLAVANSLAAVRQGVVHVQGTVNGIGERCGNANLISIIPNLALKMGCKTGVRKKSLAQLSTLSHFVDEMTNRPPRREQPFVGDSAFAHKGGIHVSAVLKNSRTYEHIHPEQVGNRQRVLVSEQSGRSNLLYKFREFGIKGLDAKNPDVHGILQRVKEMEHQGYQFDGAEASFELLARRVFGEIPNYFSLRGFRVIDERRVRKDGTRILVSDASVKVDVKGVLEHTAAEGNGPVNALDKALRKALQRFYPRLSEMSLVDFKVRILSTGGTDATVRVLIESRDHTKRWNTVGVSSNIIAASYEALVDAVIYKLFMDSQGAD